MTSLNIFFDWYGEQVQAHLQYGYQRLASLINTIQQAGWNSNLYFPPNPRSGYPELPEFIQDYYSEPHTLDKVLADDNNYDVLVLTDRFTDFPYSSKEIHAVVNFVRKGGGLWCMANHAGFKASDLSNQLNNHVASNSAITTSFFTSYQAAAYQDKDDNPVALTNLVTHPIIEGINNVPKATVSNGTVSVDKNNTAPSPIKTIVTRSFCGVYTNSFTTTIATLDDLKPYDSSQPLNVINFQDKSPISNDPNVVWAVAIDSSQPGENPSPVGKGRLVIGADAGWLGGTTPNTFPGPGQYQNGDNPQYFLNTLAWLSNKY